MHSKFCNMCCGLNERQNGYWQIIVAVQKAVTVQCLVSLTCNTQYYITKIEIYIVLYVCKEFVYSKFCNMCCRLNEQQDGYLSCELMFSYFTRVNAQKFISCIVVIPLYFNVIS